MLGCVKVIRLYRRVWRHMEFLPTADGWEWVSVREEHPLYVDLILRPASLWIGAHYGAKAQGWCISIFPGVILRIARTPYSKELA